ncbi:MAG: hemolysin family protein [Erysipelotrichaceae bacterium]|jgi:CBS domain containing-hemolysin-like protein|nr:hemolysin family protein [Erysipelotrichaceae bacterium]
MDPSQLILYLIIILTSILIGGFFSLAETAFASVNRFEIRVLADKKQKNAMIADKIIDNYDKTLITVLIGYDAISIVISSLSAVIFVKIFDTILNESVASMIATIITAIVVFLLCDTIPKTIGRRFALRSVLLTSGIIRIFNILFFPLTYLIYQIGRFFNFIFKIKEKDELTKTDFSNVVDIIELEGSIDKEEREVIESTLDFAETRVKEVYTPIEKMYALDINKVNNRRLIKQLLKVKYSRIPIYDQDINNIIGFLHVKIFLAKAISDPHVNVRSLLTKPYYISSSDLLYKILEGFKKNQSHIAIVRTESGKVKGILTLEDILEEIVDDIGEKRIRREPNG